MKFPRTYHLPYSPGKTSDDKAHSVAHIETNFLGKLLYITEKLDGECQYWDNASYHLRSESSTGDYLRSRSKSKWASIAYKIPSHIGLYIEDISNEHSIRYVNKDNPFYLIAAFDKESKHLFSYEYLEQLACAYTLQVIPLLGKQFISSYTDLEESVVTTTSNSSTLGGDLEGVVLYPKLDNVLISGWSDNTAKWVRKDHVKTTEHWITNLRKLYKR